MTLKRILGAPLGAALLLACFAGTASADRFVDYNFNHVDGATVASKLFQKGGRDRGLYLEVRIKNTRRGPGCVNGAVKWRRSGPDLEEFNTATPRPRPIRACAKRTWINLGRTPVHNVRDVSGVSTHVALEGGKGRWLGIIGWNMKGLKRRADRLMNMTSANFIKHKRVAMRNRNRAGARADSTWPLDWTDDGCSIPGEGKVPEAGHWSRVFDRPCQQHDFGYRNYGQANLRLNRREDTRLRIDNKLNRETKRVCRSRYKGRGVNQTLRRHECYGVANTIYHAVRLGGWKPFFGLD